MSKQVEFYYDYGSPTTYLAWTQLPAVAERTGAEIVRRPMLLGGVFKATDNQSPVMVEAKGKWLRRDLEIWAARYGVPYQMNPHFIINTLPIMRGAMVAQRDGFLPAYDEAMFKAMWVTGRYLDEPAAIASVLTEAGFDADAIFAAVQDSAIKQALIDATEEAVARGVFGAPCFFVDGEMFFGQDRLIFVEEALGA